MPTEILSTIVDLAGPENLPALRLTNKRLCSVSNAPFAALHFTERRHVQSAHSMDALIDITAHPFFGGFVRSVIISGSRPELRQNPFLKKVPRSCTQCTGKISSPLCKHPAPRHIPLGFVQLAGKLKETFLNIRRNSTPVHIGVCDSTFMCYGSAYYNADCTMLSRLSSRKPYLGEQFDCNRFVQTYQEIFRAARESGCQIEGTKLYVFNHTYCNFKPYPAEVEDMVLYIFRSLSGTSSFELSLETDSSGTPDYHLKYDHKTGELHLSGVDFESRQPLHAFVENHHNVKVPHMLSRLLTRPMVQVTIKYSSVEDLDLLEMVCSPRLQRLTLQNVGLYAENFDANLWSSFLHRLSRSSQLRYLEITNCRYEFEDINADGDKIQLSSGLYKVNPELNWCAEFYLVPCEDGKEKIVLSDRSGISLQVKALADRVAQMEADKIAEIEREGWVRTDIVGFIKNSDSDKDAVSDRDGHGNVQVGEDDENGDAHGEKGENGDHEELEGMH
jgi:hypothetical protein